MSLLMDALKKAEQAKQLAAAEPERKDKPVSDNQPSQGEVVESKAPVLENRIPPPPKEQAIKESVHPDKEADAQLPLSLEPLSAAPKTKAKSPQEPHAPPIPVQETPLALESVTEMNAGDDDNVDDSDDSEADKKKPLRERL